MQKTKTIKLGTKIYPYCSNRKCIDGNCLRHYTHEPYGKLIWQEKYKPNKDGICRDRIL